MSLKILHTADLHLGAKMFFLGEKAEQQRGQLKKTFAKIVDRALELNVDLFLIAGDVFDNPLPSQVNLAFFQEQIERLLAKGIFVVQIPGNHDYLAKESVYLHHNFFRRQRNNYRLITKEYDTWEIPELDTFVQAGAVTRQKSRVSPLAEFVNKRQAGKGTKQWQIGLVHGSIAGISTETNFPIDKKEIAQLNLDYLALGDWHSTLNVSVDGSWAYYSGSPETVAIDQKGAGNVIFIELETGKKPKVSLVPVGSRKNVKLALDVDKIANINQLIKEIQQYQVEDTILQVKLTGIRRLDFHLDLEDLYKHLQPEFFYLRLDDQSQLQISTQELQKYPQELITGRFIKILQERKGTDNKENALIDKAIQMGIKLLTGGET